MTDAARLQDAYGHCEALLREHDKDRFLANLFIPSAARPHVTALHAFSLEIARIRDVVREPMAGELRHQWWRDALIEGSRDGVIAHPVAAALFDTIVRFGLPREPLLALIDARGFDLYDDPMPDLAALELYCRATSSILFDLTARLIGGDAVAEDATLHAGQAYAFTGLIRALPLHASRGQVFMPMDIQRQHGVSPEDILSAQATPALIGAIRDWRTEALRHLGLVRSALTASPAIARAAFRLLALVVPYLRIVEKSGYDPFRTALDLPQWRRQWALWRGFA